MNKISLALREQKVLSFSDIGLFVAPRSIFSHQQKNSGAFREKIDNLDMKEFVKKRLNLAEALPTQNMSLNGQARAKSIKTWRRMQEKVRRKLAIWKKRSL